MNPRSQATITSRFTALLAALAMMTTFVVASATPALASAEGFARLTAGAEVLPGDFTYNLEIEASDATNLVVVNMPAGIGVTIPSSANLNAPNGFTGRVQNVGALQRVIYSGGNLAAGSEMTLEIPTSVATPTNVFETSGRFDVQLSSDSGRSFSTAEEGQSDGGGTLTTIIRFLEIVTVDTVAPTPAGAQDGSGTEGQNIDVRTTVRNYLASPVTVDLALRAVSPDTDNFGTDETISDTQRITVNGSGSADFDVQLGAAERNNGNAADRPVRFVADATEVIAEGTAVRNDRLDYEVQIPGRLSVAGASFDPRFVQPGPQTFVVDAAHAGTPQFEINGGGITLNGSTLQFDENSARAFDTGDNGTLSFSGQVPATDGEFSVGFMYQAIDENGFTFMVPFGNITEPSGGLLGGQQDVIVTIDALAPVLTAVIDLPNDSEGRQQDEAKDGDTITVEGTIDDANAELAPVELVAGGIVIATADAQRDAFDNGSFSATFDDVDFPLANGSFLARASATDRAGNLGQTVSEIEEYDNILPVLISARTEGTTEGALGGVQALVGDGARISVRFAENNTIIGGCNPNEWTVNGQQIVKEVRYTDNTACQPGQLGPDNERILILSQGYDRNSTPTVTYTPSAAAGSVKDGAGNFAIEETVTAVIGIVPPIPDLVDVYRNTGSMMPSQCIDDENACEQSFFDEDAYWTRFAGDDAVVCVAGGRSSYQIEATDGNGNALSPVAQQSTGSPDCIRVPVGGAEGTYARGVRFLNSAGAGPEVLFNLQLDQTKPAVSGVVRNGDEVTVDFNDKVVEGEDFAIDWLIYERLSSNDLVFYSPDEVTTPGDGDDADFTTRILTVDFRDFGDFAGIGYDFQSGDFGNERYGDRAGNLLDDAQGPIPPNAQ